jgi:hypothetical protein
VNLWRFWRPEPRNPNDLWEAFPGTMRGRAYVELYPPLDPETGEYLACGAGGALAKIILPPLSPPGTEAC